MMFMGFERRSGIGDVGPSGNFILARVAYMGLHFAN